ncbi:MAG: TIGR04255 family protein [Pyrinomonadaceae bacterium]|nr:TIGR04255 family protein [Pyrinomonadaceae bacterium]
MSERRYKHPTIVEAVFELRFPIAKSWGISSFVEFAGLAKQRGYPNLVDAAQGFQVNFPISSGGAPTMTPVASRVQTWNEEGTQLWQASPQAYAANRRAPYEGWEKFRPHILEGLELYREIAEPEQAEALVMQYINRIEVDIPRFRPSDLVLFVPPEIKYASVVNNFVCRTEQFFDDGGQIAVTSARDLSAQNGIVVVLDILYTARQPNLEQGVLMNEVDKAHSRIVEAFEKSITDLLREGMEPV